MKHCIAIANRKTETESAVDTVVDRWREAQTIQQFNELGISFGPVPDQYQSLHRLVDEPIWYVDCDGETRYGHDYGHVPEVEQSHLGTGVIWALAIEITIGLAIIAGIWIWRML